MLERLLREAHKHLDQAGISYALAGGLLASYYRAEIRTTLDVDIAIALSGKAGSELASTILKDIGLSPKRLTLGALGGAPSFLSRKTPVAIVGGRTEEGVAQYGLDFLLPALPWVEKAVERAKVHFIDFGFAKVPALTVEDVIISKLYSFRMRGDRYKDLDDIQSIFKKGHKLDWAYIGSALKEHGIFFPDRFEELLPVEVHRVSRKLRKKNKNLEIEL